MPINKVMRVDEFSMRGENPNYRVTIEDLNKGEIIYQADSFAGVVCTMESAPELKRELNDLGVEDLAVAARSQKLAWGHPMLALHCLDQLKDAIRPHLGKIKEFVEKTLSEPQPTQTSTTDTKTS